MLKGKGWTIYPFDNPKGQWHIHCHNGLVNVYHSWGWESNPPTFHCMVSDNLQIPNCGSMMWTTKSQRSYRDPNVAAQKEMAKAKKVLNKLIGSLNRTDWSMKAKAS